MSIDELLMTQAEDYIRAKRPSWFDYASDNETMRVNKVVSAGIYIQSKYYELALKHYDNDALMTEKLLKEQKEFNESIVY